MGNQPSTMKTYHKVERVMPYLGQPDDGSLSSLWNGRDKFFADPKDREQFIYSCITVIGNNGSIDIQNYDFRLLYSRRAAAQDRVVARLVAAKDGVIKSQIEPASDGANQAEAFMAFRRHVEMTLDGILADVPGSSSVARFADAGAGSGVLTPATTVASPPSPTMMIERRPVGGEAGPGSPNGAAPPAYGKAVREWEVQEKKG